MSIYLSRRRLITITAAATLLPLVPFANSVRAAQTPSQHWSGVAMGAQASLTLHGSDEAQTRQTVAAAIDEISRLEKIFSLFRENSSLSALNRNGELAMPPLDLVVCLQEARRVSLATNGAFDVSIQPLWELYVKHFKASGADPAGPKASDIAMAQSLIDFSKIHIATDKIILDKPGMSLSLNGIAQGYITDKVTELLRSRGFDHVLINMGETRALGNKSDGTPWQVGINTTNTVLPLANQAIATSGGYGTAFDASGQHHHLFDPATGHSTHRWSSISVVAATATTADALSTAFSALPKQEVFRIAEDFMVSVYMYDMNNKQFIISA